MLISISVQESLTFEQKSKGESEPWILGKEYSRQRKELVDPRRGCFVFGDSKKSSKREDVKRGGQKRNMGPNQSC